jgi:hypothetical protein
LDKSRSGKYYRSYIPGLLSIIGMAFFYTGNGAHHLSGCAVAALKAIMFHKGFLHGMQLITVGKAFNGGNFLPWFITASDRQLFIRRPSACTLQQLHCP